MPEISELLRDAAPSARPFDESALRRRVGQRRRRRYQAVVGVLVVLAGTGAVAAFAARGPDEASVLTEEPPADAVSALTLVHDEVWTGGDGWVDPGDGARLEVDGPVVALATGDFVWAVGRDWVQPILADTSSVYPAWAAAAEITDVQPLEARSLAVALSNGDVVIVQWFEGETTERARVTLTVPTTELVLTLGNALWARADALIARIDVESGTLAESVSWSGPLLAPSRSGGIWTMEGGRVLDLHPDTLDECVSCSEGSRYDVTATMAVETASGLYVGGPEGLSRHDPGGGEVLDPAEPGALAGDDDLVVYLVDGEVRRAHAEGVVEPIGPSGAQIHEDAGSVALSYAASTLGWSDVSVDPGARPGSFVVRSEVLGREAVIDASNGVVTYVSTFENTDDGAISIGYGDDVVTHPYVENGLVPELTVAYGGDVLLQTPAMSEVAEWRFGLGVVPDVPGTVQILWRNADGVVLEAVLTPVPAGPFAAD